MGSGKRNCKHKRAHPRTPCLLIVDYVTRGSAYRDFIKDISAGGAFIESSRPFPIGPEITLVFSSQVHQKPVRIIGEIAWTGPHGIGVRFNTPGLSILDNLTS